MKSRLGLIGGANILWGSAALAWAVWYFFALGGPALFRNFGRFRNQIRHAEYILPALLALISALILPLARVITGWGLLSLKKWAVRYTVLTILVDCIVNFSGAVYFCALCILVGNVDIPTVAGKGAHVGGEVSMLPVYIAALIDLLFISALTRHEENQ